MHFMMQQAYFHQMPLAFATATTEEWTALNQELQ